MTNSYRNLEESLQHSKSQRHVQEYPWRTLGDGGVVSTTKHVFHKAKRGWERKKATYTWLDWAAFFIPCLRWMREYKLAWLVNDILAGITIGFMVVPQGMSYANVAGLPSVYGLYGAFTPCLAYSLLGTSKQLAVGPVAVTSLLISTHLKEIVDGSSDITNPNSPTPEQVPIQDQYNHYAIQIAFLVSILYTGIGVLRLGFVTNFLSYPMIGGFTSGASVIIALSQFKYVVGYPVKPKNDRLNLIMEQYIEGMPNFQWQEFIMGMSLIGMMFAMKYIGKTSKRFRWMRTMGPITAVVIGLIVSYAGDVNAKANMKLVGPIPKGLPPPTVSWWFPMPFGDLMPIAIIVMLVDLLESTSIARALAAKNKYELNPNLEITGLGLANFVGACFHCYTTTGSFSRSSVNNESGAKSAISQFTTAWVVAFVLLFLTPVFQHLPMNVLGAIVVSSVLSLFEYEQLLWLIKTSTLDLCVWLASFFGTLFYSVEIGLAIALGLALLIVIYESAFPHTAMLGQIPGTTTWRNVHQYPDANTVPGIVVVRFDSPIYFANVQYYREQLEKYVRKGQTYAEQNGTRLYFVVLDMSPISHLDATGSQHVLKWADKLAGQGIRFMLCNPAAKVASALQRTGLLDILGRDRIFVTVNECVEHCAAALQFSDRAIIAPAGVLLSAPVEKNAPSSSGSDGLPPGKATD